jgi:hypothetical protein
LAVNAWLSAAVIDRQRVEAEAARHAAGAYRQAAPPSWTANAQKPRLDAVADQDLFQGI